MLAVALTPLVSKAVGLDFAVYDSISGINNGVNGAFTAPPATAGGVTIPRTHVGDVVNFYYPPAGPINITALGLGFAYRGPQNVQLSALNVSIRFYESNSNTPGTNALVNPVSSVLTFDIRQQIVDAFNASNGTAETLSTFRFVQANYFYELILPNVVQFADQNLNGIAINYSANSGTGLFSDNTLTSVLRVGPPIIPTRGSSGFPGGAYYRNRGGRTDFNFDQDDLSSVSVTVNGQTFNENDGVALRLFTDVVVNPVVVPEINTFALLTLGGAVAIAGLFRRRK